MRALVNVFKTQPKLQEVNIHLVAANQLPDLKQRVSHNCQLFIDLPLKTIFERCADSAEIKSICEDDFFWEEYFHQNYSSDDFIIKKLIDYCQLRESNYYIHINQVGKIDFRAVCVSIDNLISGNSDITQELFDLGLDIVIKRSQINLHNRPEFLKSAVASGNVELAKLCLQPNLLSRELLNQAKISGNIKMYEYIYYEMATLVRTSLKNSGGRKSPKKSQGSSKLADENSDKVLEVRTENSPTKSSDEPQLLTRNRSNSFNESPQTRRKHHQRFGSTASVSCESIPASPFHLSRTDKITEDLTMEIVCISDDLATFNRLVPWAYEANKLKRFLALRSGEIQGISPREQEISRVEEAKFQRLGYLMIKYGALRIIERIVELYKDCDLSKFLYLLLDQPRTTNHLAILTLLNPYNHDRPLVKDNLLQLLTEFNPKVCSYLYTDQRLDKSMMDYNFLLSSEPSESVFYLLSVYPPEYNSEVLLLSYQISRPKVFQFVLQACSSEIIKTTTNNLIIPEVATVKNLSVYQLAQTKLGMLIRAIDI